METQRFVEDAPLTGVRITDEGYLAASVPCARTGIQDYAGHEFGMPERARVRVYRPDEEVFAPKSMRTYTHRPATNDHPAESITPDNWKQHAVGHTGDEVMRDGQLMRVPMLLMDGAAIADVQAGKRQVSMGYEMALDMTPGETPDGEAYDAVARDLRMNHIAIVDRGRAGASVRIGDQWGASPITQDGTDTPTTTTNDRKLNMSTKTIQVDGLDVETTDAAAKAIGKLQAQVQAANDAVASAKAAHGTEMEAAQITHDTDMKAAKTAHVEAMDAAAKREAAKDAEIADLKAELKAKVLTDAEIHVRVAARAELVAKASQIVKDTDFSTKTDREIKSMVVAAVRGADAITDKPDAYIDAAFDFVDPPKGDTVRDALISHKPAEDTASANDTAYEQYKARISNAYKGGDQ